MKSDNYGYKKRFLANLDDTHWKFWLNKLCEEGNISREKLSEYVSWYAGTDITDLLFCIFGQTSNVPTDVLTFRGDRYLQKEQNGLPVDNSEWRFLYEIYNEKGIDLFGLWFEKCREVGINPWISLRMNDCHYPFEDVAAIRGDLFYKAKENGWMIGEEYGYPKTCLNYAVPEIRETMLDYIGEQLKRYDIFGIELDFQREITCFDYHRMTKEKMIGIMNDFMRGVNAKVCAAEEKRGHKIMLSVRLPRNIDEIKEYGFDAITWAAEKIIDAVVVTPRWSSCDSAMPIETWRKELAGTEIYAGIETHINTQNPSSHAAADAVNGYMAQYLSKDVDGIYLFNYMKLSPVDNRSDAVFNSFSSVSEVLNSKRRHIIGYQDSYPEGYEPYHPLDRELTCRQTYCFEVDTGIVPDSSRLRLILGFDGEIENGDIDVSVNGEYCGFIGTAVVTADDGHGGVTDGRAYVDGDVYFREFSLSKNVCDKTIQKLSLTSNLAGGIILRYCEIDVEPKSRQKNND